MKASNKVVALTVLQYEQMKPVMLAFGCTVIDNLLT